MRKILAALVLVSVVGCGVSVGGTNAVENVTLGELVVGSTLQRHHTRDDQQKMLKKLRAQVPFDVDKKLSAALNENSDVSDVQIDARAAASDATSINVSLKVNGGFDIKLSFVAQRMSFLVVDLVKAPYLLNIQVTKDGIDLRTSGAIPNDLDFMAQIYLDKDLAKSLQSAWSRIEVKQAEALRQKNAKEREKKIQEFIGEWEPNPELSEQENRATFEALEKEAEAKFPL